MGYGFRKKAATAIEVSLLGHPAERKRVQHGSHVQSIISSSKPF